MSERCDKIKQHFRNHKEAYIVGCSCIVIAGITCVMVRRRYALSDEKPPYVAHRAVKSSPTEHTVSIINSNIKNAFNTKILNVLEREGRGHPGYMVRCLETNVTYPSQKEAAIAIGVSQTHLCDHLNGRLDHVDGKHFERIFLAENAA